VLTGGQAADELNHLLLLLAHTRQPAAVNAIRRWVEHPPIGMDRLHVGPVAYAKEGGWTLRPDGTRRDLCAPVAYQLPPTPAPHTADGPTCPWCGSPLWTILDVDTSQNEIGQAFAHTG
jgi:hypothetical protein